MPESSRESSGLAAAAGGRFFGMLVASLALVAIGFVLGTMFSDRSAEPAPAQVGMTAPATADNAEATVADTNPVATTTPAPVPARGLPAIAIHPPAIELGMLRPGESASGSVRIRNVGHEPIRILDSRSSCRCTSVNLANTVIEPGESVPLNAQFEAGSSLGAKSESVRVRFEGYTRLIEVPVRAEVAMPVRAAPGYLLAVDDLSGSITIESVDGRPFSILATHGESPQFIDFDPATDPPRNRYYVKWDLTRCKCGTSAPGRGCPAMGANGCCRRRMFHSVSSRPGSRPSSPWPSRGCPMRNPMTPSAPFCLNRSISGRSCWR
ncbi:MAG: DUF1573 domain-containing protein [Planctomycetota bacterium]|jgi:hypothetical protein